MESKLPKFVSVIIVTMLFLAILPAYADVPSEPHTAPAMWIEPSTINVLDLGLGVGDKFNVTVWVNMDVASYTWQFKILYNKAQLKALRAGYTHGAKSDFFDFAGSSTVPVTPMIGSYDATRDFVLHGESLMGDIKRDPGTGSLSWVEFEIMASPPPAGTLESDLDITTTYATADTYVLTPDLASITLTPYNAHYKYAYAAPPKPHLAVDPAYTEFLQYPPSSVGKEFDIKIYVMSLKGEWSLQNASLHLGFDASLIEIVDVVFDPLWATTNKAVVPGDLEIFVGGPATNPVGDVLIATVTFNVTHQGESPPRPAGDFDESPLDLHDYKLMGLYMQVDMNPEVDGKVRIYCLVTIEPPHLEVSSATLGPEPSVGQEFDIAVSIKNLSPHMYLIGVQFRLSYDPTYLEALEPVEEGPFLPGFAALQPGSLGPPFFQSFVQSNGFGPHVLVGEMIFPNATGWWHPPWPEGEGVIAIITFRLLKQDLVPPQETVIPLNIIDQLAVGLDDPATQNPKDVSLYPPINGTVTIYNRLPGRIIDVYGGLESKPFPAPYGGQGPHEPMDMVWPQKEVSIYANVTYNFWPVQYKIVAFEVEGPFDLVRGQTLVPKPKYDILTKTTAITNESGVAKITFRMPWQCMDAEDYFGVWKVTATVDIACEVMNDTLLFHYDYLVRIWKVTTDKYTYRHCESVNMTITYGTHAQQLYPALFTSVIYDELNVPIGINYISLIVGGVQRKDCGWCTYKNCSLTLVIHIPKFAFAGVATIHVNCFDKDPTVGGQAWCPEYTPPPKIYIKPE